MELVSGGSLTELLQNKAMSENRTKYIIKQLVKTLNYLHSTKQITHRDIKPDNVLIVQTDTSDPLHDKDKIRVKLTDFGFATFFE